MSEMDQCPSCGFWSLSTRCCGRCGQLAFAFEEAVVTEDDMKKAKMLESKKCPTCSRTFLAEDSERQCESCREGGKSLING